jgi:hypothetical protein
MVDAIGLEHCISGSFKTLALGTKGDIGPLGWKFELKGQIKAKYCEKCCADGRTEIDEEANFGLVATLALTGKTSGGSLEFGGVGWGGKFETEVKASYWYGIKGEVGGTFEANGVLKTDKCHKKGLSGSVCVTGTVFGSLSVGGEISFQWGWFRVTAGLAGTATGSISGTKCYSCENDVCQWGPTKICLSASVDVTFSFIVGSVSLNIWNGKTCFDWVGSS